MCQAKRDNKTSSLEINPACKDNYQFYPPLLQLESVDCSAIDSKIALELRLPPKVPYRFVFIRYGLSGGAALTDFLSHAGVVESTYKDISRKIKGAYSYLCINHLWQREEKKLAKSALYSKQ